MVRKKEIIFLLLACIIAGYIIVSNAPLKREYSDSPEGWSGGAKGIGLASLVSNFNIISTQLYLKSNDYIRILYYASLGYIEAEYKEKKDGDNVFYQIIKELVGEPDFNTQLPDSYSSAVSSKIVKLANNDGYRDIDKVFIRSLSPVDLGVDRSLYTWRPDATLGNEYDPYWGTLTKSQEYSCKIDIFPLVSYEELVKEANLTAKATVNMFNSKFNSEIRNLVTNFTSPQNGQPGRVLINIFLNYLNDNNFDAKNRDEILYNFINSLYDLSILTYKEKYHYQIAHLGQLSTVMMQQSWLQTRPPFPSEFGSFGRLFELFVNKFGSGKSVRLTIPGSQVSTISTRVYNDGSSFFKEFTNASILFGFDYFFSIEAGRKLGECLFDEYTYKKV